MEVTVWTIKDGVSSAGRASGDDAKSAFRSYVQEKFLEFVLSLATKYTNTQRELMTDIILDKDFFNGKAAPRFLDYEIKELENKAVVTYVPTGKVYCVYQLDN